jgi:hypothetical protein
MSIRHDFSWFDLLLYTALAPMQANVEEFAGTTMKKLTVTVVLAGTKPVLIISKYWPGFP